MGTVVSFDVRIDAGASESTMRAAIGRAVEWLHWVDAVFSTYKEDSQISRLGRRELALGDCDPRVAEVLDLCAQVHATTNGYFAVSFAGRLDPTGLVKGWAIQRASELLSAGGSRRHSVNGGGDVSVVGEPEPGRAWNIGIAHPAHPGAFASVVRLRDGAVATSGTAERGAHIVDPFTGAPARDLASVTVVGADLTFADSYATAAVAMGHAARDWLEDLDGYEGFAVAQDGTGWWTSGYPEVGSVPAPA